MYIQRFNSTRFYLYFTKIKKSSTNNHINLKINKNIFYTKKLCFNIFKQKAAPPKRNSLP